MNHGPLKLRTRIGMHFLALIGTWTLFVLLLLGNLLSGKLQELFRGQGAGQARALALECAPLIAGNDRAGLERLLTERVAGDASETRYVVVLSARGQILASTLERGVPAELLAVGHPTEALPGVGVALIDSETERLYDYSATAPGITVRMGTSLTSVQLYAHEVTMYILWIGLAAFLSVLAVTLHVSRPVEALANAIANQSDVHLSAPFDGTFETSALAGWLEHMNQRLDESSRRLDQSKKLAYLGEIAASIAHEVNNPLGIIVLNADFLARRAVKGELPVAALTEVERIRAAAQRATFAAQQLLQVGRYTTRRQEMRRRPTRPQPVLAEVLELLRDRVRVSGCELTVDVPADLPAVPLDAQGVQQVLFNLLTNALDATPSGRTLAVRARLERDAFVLTVQDQGQGMSAELLDRAKEPFVTTKEAGKGTGLGLAISDSIVRGHGGTLALTSQVGVGTTATVTIPLGQKP
jgi:two-component system NtrC family sensor kinase